MNTISVGSMFAYLNNRAEVFICFIRKSDWIVELEVRSHSSHWYEPAAYIDVYIKNPCLLGVCSDYLYNVCCIIKIAFIWIELHMDGD